MLKFIAMVGLFVLPLLGQTVSPSPEISSPSKECTSAQSLYAEMNLEGVVDAQAFASAIAGYEKITERKRDILTLIDFSKPSNEERLFVFDMNHKKLLFSSVVAHGRNSGDRMATKFSNQDGSHKSSLGFYLTENTYQGKNGYSLVLEGLEKGINDNARRRAIVMHGADYANANVTKTGARLGRSFGCPALPRAINRPIIDAIKGGSVLYIYAGNAEYLAKSALLNDPAKA